MIKFEQKHDCCGCEACKQICPKGCITMQVDEEGFCYPEVDSTACIDCGLCERACPVLIPSTKESLGIPTAYAAVVNDEKLREKSSSGGIFTLLAEETLKTGGVVFGAAFTEDFRAVYHCSIENCADLDKLRGSKYLQSRIGDTYIQVKQVLDTGRQVLFTGTPCQVEGLKAFLRKDYDNLFCMDIICHGVPSPLVWAKYVSLKEQEAGSAVTQISFRHKRYGWKKFAIMMIFLNAGEYVCWHGDDPFMKVFLQNLCLRPSCYQCKFKKENRVSDITVADFWGIENVRPEMDDGKGTSLVVVHSPKGAAILKEISQRMRIQEADYIAAIQDNPSMVQSVKKPQNRDCFMQEVCKKSFLSLEKKYTRRPISTRDIIRKVLQHLGLLDSVRRLIKR